MTDLINLKPCPFCGGKADPIVAKTEDGEETYSVTCSKCRIGIFQTRMKDRPEQGGFDTIYEAVAAYNRRTNDDE